LIQTTRNFIVALG